MARWEDEGGFTIDREIPIQIQNLLGAVLYERAWHRWMNTHIGALQGRTPWQCIDSGDEQTVIDLLESYSDGSFS